MQKRLQALLLTAFMVWSMAVPAMGAGVFPDVSQDHWAFDAVEYLAELGLIEGYPDGTFGGSRNFTRYEMAQSFARFVRLFEQYVDQRVEQGIASSLDDLAAQVAEALKEAQEALRLAKAVTPEQVAEALEAAREAQRIAQEAMEVAVGTLEAIDARGIELGAGDEAGVSLAAAKAEEALKLAEQAIAEASAALDVAVGTLEAIDARGWEDELSQANAGAELANAQALAAAAAAQQAMSKAEEALRAAQEAMDVAVGTLEVIDSRDYDARINSAAAQADQALALAEQALVAAQEARDVAVGTLEAIDALGLAEASQKADEALALARSIAAVTANGGQIGVPTFTNEARAAIEEIAAAVVAEKLEALKANADLVAGRVDELSTDLDAAKALIQAEANRLERAILAQSAELSAELAALGVRVGDLERKFTSLESRVTALEDRLDRFSFSGFYEATATVSRTDGPEPYKLDPRDKDSDDFEVPETGVANRLQVRFAGMVNDEVHLLAVGDVVVDTRHLPGLRNLALGMVEDSNIFVEATSPNPVRLLRIGYLDKNQVARGFAPELLDAKAFGDANVGAFATIVSGSAQTEVFASAPLPARIADVGVTTSFPLGDEMDLRLSAVRRIQSGADRTGLSLHVIGNYDDLAYDALLVSDVENKARYYKVTAEMPVDAATITGFVHHIDPVWDEADRLPFAVRVKKQDPAKADKVLDIDGEMYAGQSIAKARVDVPLGSFSAFAQAGTYTSVISDDPAVRVRDSFTQFGVYDLQLLGFDTAVTRTDLVDQHNRVLTDQRASFTTKLEDIDFKLELNQAVNGQISATNVDAKRSQFMVTLEKPVQIFFPWVGTVSFGANMSDLTNVPAADQLDERMHAAYKLVLEDYALTPTLKIGAEIGGENNVITDGKWRLNSTWTGQNQTTRAIDANWHAVGPIHLTAGYKVIDNDVIGLKQIGDAGFEYQLEGAFGGDLTVGYGWRVVTLDGVVDGSHRNVISAAFTRTAGGFTLNADAKHYIGGTSDEPGNDVDTVATVNLKYPVFKGADFTIDGRYVRSSGDKAADYTASSVAAGLRFTF